MPRGRKSGGAQKGGGFGASLGKNKAVGCFNFQRPDPERLKAVGDGPTKQIQVMDFVSADKAKSSCLEAQDLDDYFAQTLAQQNSYAESRNLVVKARGGNGFISIEAPTVIDSKNKKAPVSSLFGAAASSSGLFQPRNILGDLPLPRRPFLFRDPANRVIDFAAAFGKQAYLAETGEEDSKSKKITKDVALSYALKCNDIEILKKAINVYFERRENFAPFLTAEELDKEESAAFSRWRKHIGSAEDSRVIAPYEKNLAYWKQLWRTIERSDLVIEVVDARNPLLFRCKPLEDLVTEMSREVLLLMNKTDFLSPLQRKIWKDYFEAQNLDVIFYSAARELELQQGDNAASAHNKLSRRLLANLSSTSEDDDAENALKETLTTQEEDDEEEIAPRAPRPNFAALIEDTDSADENSEEDQLGSRSSSQDAAAPAAVASQTNEEAPAEGQSGETADEEQSKAERSYSAEDLAEGHHSGGKKFVSVATMEKTSDFFDLEELVSYLDERGAKILEKKQKRYQLAQLLYKHLATLTEGVTFQNRVEIFTALRRNALNVIDPWDPAMMGGATETFSDDEDKDDDDTSSSSSSAEAEGEAEAPEGEAGEPTEGEAGEGEDEERAALVRPVELSKETMNKLRKDLLTGLLGPQKSLELDEAVCVDENVMNGSANGARRCLLRPVIGTTGFPNVGKSSIINSLLRGTKRVGISRTPGKTRHLQTLEVPNAIFTLCDCPGLVFPTTAHRKEELVIGNVMSVDTYRGSLVGPVGCLLERIQYQIEEVYGVSSQFEELERLLEVKGLATKPREAIEVIAVKRGYLVRGKGGVPDVERTSRAMIKGYCGGWCISYCEAPPPGRGSREASRWEEEERRKWAERRGVLGCY